jgi:hypothetical protein
VTTTYTRTALAAARRIGNITANGVCFRGFLEGQTRIQFALLREPCHTDGDIEAAKQWLLVQRSGVVAIDVHEPDQRRPLSRAEAMEAFARLVRRYGMQWTARTGAAAADWDLLERCNEVLTTADRRAAVGLPS